MWGKHRGGNHRPLHVQIRVECIQLLERVVAIRIINQAAVSIAVEFVRVAGDNNLPRGNSARRGREITIISMLDITTFNDIAAGVGTITQTHVAHIPRGVIRQTVSGTLFQVHAHDQQRVSVRPHGSTQDLQFRIDIHRLVNI